MRTVKGQAWRVQVLKWAIFFFIISIIAGAFGFTGISAAGNTVFLAGKSTVQYQIGGGNAGHNGLRSISAHCGNEYRRVRLGIGHPGHKALVQSHVLGDFGKGEEAWVDDLCRFIADNAVLLAKGEDGSFQNKVHLAMEARGWTDVKRPGEKAT